MFWKLICSKYINKNSKVLHIPIGILGNFENKFVVYDANDNVKYGAKNMYEAIKYCKKENLYMTKIINNL